MEEFYRLNPKKLTRYQPYLNEQYKQRLIVSDESAWRHGNYVQIAIGTAFAKGKRYPNKPLLMDNFTVDEDGEVYEMTDADRFWAFAESMNQSREIKAIDAKIAEERAKAEADENAETPSTDSDNGE